MVTQNLLSRRLTVSGRDVYFCGNILKGMFMFLCLLSDFVDWNYLYLEMFLLCLLRVRDQIYLMLMVWRWTGFHVISSGLAMTLIRNRLTSPDSMAPSKTLLSKAWINLTALCCTPYWGKSTATHTHILCLYIVGTSHKHNDFYTV